MTPSLLNVTEDSKFTFLQILTSSDGCTAECTGESYLPVLAGCCDTHNPPDWLHVLLKFIVLLFLVSFFENYLCSITSGSCLPSFFYSTLCVIVDRKVCVSLLLLRTTGCTPARAKQSLLPPFFPPRRTQLVQYDLSMTRPHPATGVHFMNELPYRRIASGKTLHKDVKHTRCRV